MVRDGKKETEVRLVLVRTKVSLGRCTIQLEAQGATGPLSTETTRCPSFGKRGRYYFMQPDFHSPLCTFQNQENGPHE